jgi:hypothetical protein
MATPASMSPSLPSSASRFAPRGAPCALTPPALRATAVPRGASLDGTSDNPRLQGIRRFYELEVP